MKLIMQKTVLLRRLNWKFLGVKCDPGCDVSSNGLARGKKKSIKRKSKCGKTRTISESRWRADTVLSL